MSAYLPLLEGKRVGLVVNQTAVVTRPSDGQLIPLPDTLLSRGVNIRCIMAPEHGYKGTAEAGAHITNGKDAATGLNIYSLYGNNKKPKAEWMKEVDVLVFDIQDVGCRFYTYLSTLYRLRISYLNKLQKRLVNALAMAPYEQRDKLNSQLKKVITMREKLIEKESKL